VEDRLLALLQPVLVERSLPHHTHLAVSFGGGGGGGAEGACTQQQGVKPPACQHTRMLRHGHVRGRRKAPTTLTRCSSTATQQCPRVRTHNAP
jgi:hypothetical protein